MSHGTRQSAIRFVVLVGVMSLFADMAYEGARSINGPYLALLGASATAVGVVAGGGELLGYSLRVVSGRFADVTGRYWPVTIVGYVIQMAAVPALALAGSWQVAAVLIALERTGKALRNPPRDAMLAHASRDIGRGFGFGLHEGLDQIGALAGPLLAAAILAMRGDYRIAFAFLLIPALTTLAIMGVARLTYPDPTGAGRTSATPAPAQPLPTGLWIYLVVVMLVGAGFADFSLIAYHFATAHTVAPELVPLYYAGAMGISGAGSLLFGRWFDRRGLLVLAPLTLVSALAAPLAFLGTAPVAFAGVLLWGSGMGVHESIMAAAVAGMVPGNRIASAIGLFNLSFGLAWFAGSAVMGVLYGISVPALVAFSMVAQLLAIPLLFRIGAGRPRATPGQSRP